MINKKKMAVLASVSYAIFLTGCAYNVKIPTDGMFSSKESLEPEISEEINIDTPIEEAAPLTIKEALEKAKEDGLYSSDETRMLELEMLKNSDGLSRDEYAELVSIYEKLGFMLNARDTLEEAYKLSISDEYIDQLNDIFVDYEEESENVQKILNTMSEYLKNAAQTGDFSRVITLLESDEWNNAVMPFVRAGYRNYYGKEDDKIDFIVKTGYSSTGETKNRIYSSNKTEEGSCGVILEQDGHVLSLYIENSKDEIPVNEILKGKQSKSFSYYIIDSSAGTVRTEEGTIDNGVFTGDYYASLVSGEFKTAHELYEAKDNLTGEYYKGFFSETGKANVAEPAKNSVTALAKAVGTDTIVVYAYNDKKNKCLYKGVSKEEAEAGVVFGSTSIEVETAPSVKTYEVKKKMEVADLMPDSALEKYVLESEIKIRIYNGQIQVFNGTVWLDYGDANEYVEADPLNEAAELIKANMETLKKSLEESETTEEGKNTAFMAGSVTTGRNTAGTTTTSSNSSSQIKANTTANVATTTQNQTAQPTTNVQPTAQPAANNTEPAQNNSSNAGAEQTPAGNEQSGGSTPSGGDNSGAGSTPSGGDNNGGGGTPAGGDNNGGGGTPAGGDNNGGGGTPAGGNNGGGAGNDAPIDWSDLDKG